MTEMIGLISRRIQSSSKFVEKSFFGFRMTLYIEGGRAIVAVSESTCFKPCNSRIRIFMSDFCHICGSDDNILIGNVSLSCVRERIKLCHRAELAIAILPGFRGQGLGRRLMKAAIRKAKEHGYLQVELEVASSNIPARKLYESLGFRKQGVHSRAFRLKDGTFLNLYDMVLALDEE